MRCRSDGRVVALACACRISCGWLCSLLPDGRVRWCTAKNSQVRVSKDVVYRVGILTESIRVWKVMHREERDGLLSLTRLEFVAEEGTSPSFFAACARDAAGTCCCVTLMTPSLTGHGLLLVEMMQIAVTFYEYYMSILLVKLYAYLRQTPRIVKTLGETNLARHMADSPNSHSLRHCSLAPQSMPKMSRRYALQ